MVLNCIIVDDEIMARKSLERLCGKLDSLHLLDVCENAEDAILVLKEKKVDLIFLDIEMPDTTGIELVQSAITLPQVIFTTSKTEYAFEAFEHQVTDYIQKPIKLPRLIQAVDKALEIFKNSEHHKDSDEIYIKEDGRYIKILYDDILYIENLGDYAKITTSNGSHTIHSTMKYINSRLQHKHFIKVHRSFIVNLKKIVDIEENTLVIASKVIPISRANKPLLMSKLNLL